MQLDWEQYMEIGNKFQHKARYEDREDLRQDIIVRLAEVANNNGHKPFTEGAMVRVASYVAMEYWHNLKGSTIKVCLLNGVGRKPNYRSCSFKHKPNSCSKCAFIASRPIGSLNEEIEDGEGDSTELYQMLADDKAIDLDGWLDAKRWLLGCPKQLVKIAYKRETGKPLTEAERQYLSRYRQKELAKRQKALF